MTIGDARVRLTRATQAIANLRLTTEYLGDEDAVKAAGYYSLGEYWDDALSEPMPKTKFIHLLATHQWERRRISEEKAGQAPALEMLIAHSLSCAFKYGEPWIIKTPDEIMVVRRPREAVEWLLRMPMHRDRVPLTLRAVIEGAKPPVDLQELIAPAERLPRRKKISPDEEAEILRYLQEIPPCSMTVVNMHRDVVNRFNVDRITARCIVARLDNERRLGPGKHLPKSAK